MKIHGWRDETLGFEDHKTAGMSEFIDFVYDDSNNICGITVGDADFYVGETYNGLEILAISKKAVTYRYSYQDELSYIYEHAKKSCSIANWLRLMSL